MPNPYRLAILSERRQIYGVTLQQMAIACGLSGKSGRNAVSSWEQGQSVPHSRRRYPFIKYLAHTLALHNDPAQLQVIWEMLIDEWGWTPLTQDDWQYINNVPTTYHPPGNPIASK